MSTKDGLPGKVVTRVAIAPNGARIAYTSGGLLWVRDLDRLEPRSLAGTEGAIKPFWSPDGEWIAYASGRKLWKVRVTGGEPSALWPGWPLTTS